MSETVDSVRALMSLRGQVAAMLEVEATLAEALAELGQLPLRAARVIRSEATVESIDLEAVAREVENAGNPLIPVIEQLAARVGAIDPEAAGWVHVGVTSQDVIDLALVLSLRTAVSGVRAELDRATAAGALLARRYAETPMAGRTLLQYAVPTSFGLKAAGWTDAIARSSRRIGRAIDAASVLQLGGAAGTLAALGASGLDLERALAARLSLEPTSLPWHAQRDRLVELAAALGIAVGSLGKMAQDVVLLAQTEVGEATEGGAANHGRSSAMPHKRNPVRAVSILAAAARAPGLVATMLTAMRQEHERAAGGWQAEWQTLPELVILAAEAASSAAALLEGLEVHPERMAANLAHGGGILASEAVASALGRKIGMPAAKRLLARASRRVADRGETLRDAVLADPEITRHLELAELDRLLDPASGLGRAQELVQRALARIDQRTSNPRGTP